MSRPGTRTKCSNAQASSHSSRYCFCLMWVESGHCLFPIHDCAEGEHKELKTQRPKSLPPGKSRNTSVQGQRALSSCPQAQVLPSRMVFGKVSTHIHCTITWPFSPPAQPGKPSQPPWPAGTCPCVCVCVCLCKGLLSMLSHYWGAQRCRDRPGGTPFGVKGPHVCRCGFIGTSLCQSPLPAFCVAVSGTGLLLSSCSGFLVGPGAQGSQGDPGSLAHPSAPWAPAGLGTLSSQRSLVLPEAPLALEPPGGPLALGAPHPPWGPAVLLHPQFRSCPLTL